MNTAGTKLKIGKNLESEFFPFFTWFEGKNNSVQPEVLISLYSYFMHSKCEANPRDQEIVSRL